MNEHVELVEELLESLDTPNTELNAIWAKASDTCIEAYDNNQLREHTIKSSYAL